MKKRHGHFVGPLIALSLLSSPLFAQSWSMVGSSDEGAVVVMDTDSVIRVSHETTAWIMIAFARAEAGHPKKWKWLIKSDCRARVITTLARINYDESDRIVSSENDPKKPGPSRYVEPGSVNEMIFGQMCTARQRDGS